MAQSRTHSKTASAKPSAKAVKKPSKKPAAKKPAAKKPPARANPRSKSAAGTKDDFLKLPDGGDASDVYVSSFVSISGTLAGFASKETGTYYTKGISWKYKKTTLMVTFHLLGDVQQLVSDPTSAVRFSPVCNGTQTALLPKADEDDSFTVNFTKGSHDPQIIISPG